MGFGSSCLSLPSDGMQHHTRLPGALGTKPRASQDRGCVLKENTGKQAASFQKSRDEFERLEPGKRGSEAIIAVKLGASRNDKTGA